jgi:RNA-binding protein
MLTGKQKRHLRSLAHHVTPIMQIGKNSLTENFVKTFNDALDSHELIKISVLPSCVDDKESLQEALVRETHCDLVQIIGNQLVFYRRSTKEGKKDHIELP